MALVLAHGVSAMDSPRFADRLSTGTVDFPGLNEASGVAVSRNNQDVLWTHNDKGGLPRIYAIDAQGRGLGIYNLPGAEAVDYEDIALGPGPVPEVQYLYVGDIGDGNKNPVRPSIQVYRVPEPAVNLRQSIALREVELKGVEVINLRYPDGPRNAETLMIDPISGDLFLISQTKEPSPAGIYRAKSSQLEAGGEVVMARVGDIIFDVANAGDISPDGREIIIRQERFAMLYIREPGQTIASALAGEPFPIPIVGKPIEQNGEAIAFDASGSGYYTLSDSSQTQPLYYFARTSRSEIPRRQVLVNAGSSWRYLDDETDPPTQWRTPGFDDQNWRSGEAQFGYGDGDEQTLIAGNTDGDVNTLTTYFRKMFVVPDKPAFFRLELRLLYDDAAAVYLNGSLVSRVNLSVNANSVTTTAAQSDGLEDTWSTFEINPAFLVTGNNTLAVEIHQQDTGGHDMSFDAQLISIESRPTRITSVSRLANGGVQLHVESRFAELTVQGSTDLKSWSDMGTVRVDDGTGVYTDWLSAIVPHLFYRLCFPGK